MNAFSHDEIRLCVVEDNSFDLKATCTVLENVGFEIVSRFESAEALIEAYLEPVLDEPPCDLILLDFNLPGMNGIDLCQRLKKSSLMMDVPVIMITGEASMLELQYAYEQGAVDFIRKPFNRIELIARVSLAAKNRLLQKQLQNLAHYDQLTGLVNRTLFLNRLDQFISLTKRQSTRLALLFVDLDNFKPLNDTLGHKLGDIALQLAAKKLLSCVRDTDTVGRFGGDEFVILLPDIASRDSIHRILDKIEAEFSDPLLLHEGKGGRLDWLLGASIGYAIYPDDSDNCQELLKMADEAMYKTKASRKKN
jgi:two-component system cell cycle response regulator